MAGPGIKFGIGSLVTIVTSLGSYGTWYFTQPKSVESALKEENLNLLDVDILASLDSLEGDYEKWRNIVNSTTNSADLKNFMGWTDETDETDETDDVKKINQLKEKCKFIRATREGDADYENYLTKGRSFCVARSSTIQQ